MYGLATCTGSVLRGTTEDVYGDETPTDTVAATNVLASIRETRSTVFDQVTQTPRVARVTTAQFQSDTDIRTADRFRDDTHNVTYRVENVTTPGGPGLSTDQIAELRRVT